ncbi:MAG TPA: cupin domain-containing protein [Ktedonobacterales bacterium]|nr:cupin domain-containing protein [Ktedonobacterales bacterium]
MPATIIRWADSHPPDPDALLARLCASGYAYSTWGNAPGDTYAVHSHSYDKHLVCLRGTIRFTLPATGEAEDLAAGDELHLPAGTSHGAIVGADGVQCAEAHLIAG